MNNDFSRRNFLALMGAGLVVSATAARAQSGQRLYAYVGSWTQGPFGVGGGGGLHVFSVDMSNGSLTPVSRTTGPEFENFNVGYIAVSPNGRFLYGANRSQDVVDFNGNPVYKGGENSIVVYAIDAATGEPNPIQHIETRGIHPRTFHIDPSGRMMVVQHNLPVNVREGEEIRTVAAGLSVFRIADDGKLTFVRKYDVDVGDKIMFWMGMVPL